jgi:PAS domain-containing protein
VLAKAVFQSIVDGIPALCALMTPAGEVEHVNRQVLEYFGVTLEELTRSGRSATAFIRMTAKMSSPDGERRATPASRTTLRPASAALMGRIVGSTYTASGCGIRTGA